MAKIVDVRADRYLEKVDVADFGKGADILVVGVETDEGVSGTGFLSLFVTNQGELGDVYAILINRIFRNLILGYDANATEQLWDLMYRTSVRWGRLGVALQCISAIDTALWDIKAKMAGMPLWQLLGGPVKDPIPAYANTAQHLPPDELAARARDYVDQGFDAIKIRGSSTAVSTDEATDRVRAVREAIGPDVKLMVDVNGTWDVPTAIEMMNKWEPYRLFWLEEPVPPDDVLGYVKVRQVAQRMGVNIAGGEQHGTRSDFRALFEAEAVDIVQPDCSIVGGVTEFVRIAELAQYYSVQVSPHTVQHVHNHLVAALPGLMWVEYFMHDNPLREFTLRLVDKPVEAIEHVGGNLRLPTGAGIGVELNPEVAEAHRAT